MLSRRAFFSNFSARPEPSESAGDDATGARIAVLGAHCLAVTGVMCGTCVDPCEPRALRLRPLLGGKALPIIDAAACTGCGECVSVCPVGALSVAPAPAKSENVRCA